MTRNVLITGAGGRIGTALTTYVDTGPRSSWTLHLGDLSASSERSVLLDVTDYTSCEAACRGMDSVIHLAGIAEAQSPFDALLPTNIVGTHNVFRAAKEARVRRVVFASSAQVVEGYPLDVQVRPDMPVRPKNLYGVSKAFGEAVASYFAYQEGVEAVAVRIGAFETPSDWTSLSARDLSAWADPRDLCELLIACVEADLGPEPFAIAHGISNNRFKRLDLSDTLRRFGYAPKRDAFTVWDIGLQDRSRAAFDG